MAPRLPKPQGRSRFEFWSLSRIFFSRKENVSEFLYSINNGVLFHEIPTDLACAYLKGHLIGRAKDWFEVIDQVRIYHLRERAEGVVETNGLNGEGSRTEQVETEGSKGLARIETSKAKQWRGKRMRSKGSTEYSNKHESQHQSKWRPPEEGTGENAVRLLR
ncbi:hypothetical protein NPIL_263561 [Nephila pilipes]|uniref:Uncharacterized protein n=1 Tax=Nephila pilipes TaxID=299642 RepID=A0A8X6QFC8_NEPPI|nr:hypothetical protein NPIL_263561 [Nephila pilipes]